MYIGHDGFVPMYLSTYTLSFYTYRKTNKTIMIKMITSATTSKAPTIPPTTAPTTDVSLSSDTITLTVKMHYTHNLIFHLPQSNVN